MTIRDTLTLQNIRSRQQMHRRQVRYFALVWTGITLLVGAFTFAAVYTATGVAARNGAGAGAGLQGLPPAGAEAPGALVAQITATPFPTLAPTDTPEPPPPASPTPEPAVEPTQVLPPPPTPTVIPILDTAFDLGIAIQKNPDPNVFALWVDMAGSQLRLNWVKTQVVWRDMEQVRGQIDFGELDVTMNALHQGNMRVLLSIVKAPDWARDTGARIQPGVFDGPPANPQDYANFVAAVIQRYPGMIHAIEVWNEVNIDREWTTNPPRIDARRYVDLLRVAYETIKAIDPNIIVVTSGLSPTGANIPGAVTDDFIYMDQMIEAGALQYADCVGTHHNGLNVPPEAVWNNIPERNPPARFRGPWENPHHSWSFRSTLEGYAERIRRAGSSLQLCVTEFGWPSVEDLQNRGRLRDGFGFAADNTLADQRDFTVRAIQLMQEWGFVRLAFIWNLNYGAQAGWMLSDPNTGQPAPTGDNVPWSILGPDFIPRPVWQAIVDMDFRGRPRSAAQ